MSNETMQLLEQQFDTAFAAPDGIQKLRELILTLAMQGKLVPQDPSDQPASELLKAIEAEKQRLVKEKKIRYQKSLPDIQPEEIPYVIPNSWEWCYLDDICSLITDGTHHTPTYTETGIPFISVKNLSSGRLDFSDTKFISEQEHSELVKRCHPEEGNILLTKVGTTGIAVAIETSQDFSIFVSVALLKLVQEFINKNYITRLINSPLVKKYSADGTEGVGNKNLVLRKIKAFIIPVPPLDEQRRIVAKIDQLMARCDELEKLRSDRAQKLITVHTAALNRLLTAQDNDDFTAAWHFITQHFSELYSVKETVAELRKTILQLAVMGKLVPQDPNDEPASELLKAIELEKQRLVKEGKIKQFKPSPNIKTEEVPYELPKGWTWCRWNDVALQIGDVDHKMPVEMDNGVPYISPRDFFGKNEINFEQAKKISIQDFEELRAKIQPEKFDIIFPRYGTLGVNRFVLVDIDFLASYSCAIVKNLQNFIAPKYSYYYSISQLVRSEIERYTKKTTQANVGVKSIQIFLYPLPPIAEQHRIVAKVDQLMVLCDRLEVAIATAQTKQTDLLNAVMAQV